LIANRGRALRRGGSRALSKLIHVEAFSAGLPKAKFGFAGANYCSVTFEFAIDGSGSY
jgi:hypothetical protein